jgi:hypothetical protein
MTVSNAYLRGEIIVSVYIVTIKLLFCKKYFLDSYITSGKGFSITRTNWLILFKEMIAVSSENHMKRISRLCRAGEY